MGAAALPGGDPAGGFRLAGSASTLELGFAVRGTLKYMVDAIERMKSGLGRESLGVIPV